MTDDPFGTCLDPDCKELPSVIEMVKNLAGSVVNIIDGAVQGDGVLVLDEIHTFRMRICHSCEFFNKEKERCIKCGCFMQPKTKFKKVYCPIGKWGEVL